MQSVSLAHSLPAQDLCFYDARQAPFALYGHAETTPGYVRMPGHVANQVSEGVADLAKHTSGLRLRFATDSPYVAISVKMPGVTHFAHMPLTGTSGFDLFEDTENGPVFRGNFVPPTDMTDGYEAIRHLPNRKMRGLTLHFPLYNAVDALYIGLAEGAQTVAGQDYLPLLPILFYGSSITQGGCASRPGNGLTNLVSTHLNRDVRCLGFSGSARAEPAMVDYLAGCACSAFVLDYDHNAPDAAHLAATHEPLFQAFRKTHPNTPVLMLSRPDFDGSPQDSAIRRDIILQTFLNARKQGDENVLFLDGARFFDGPFRQSGTVDGCHPNDVGFVAMAKAVLAGLAQLEGEHA